MTVPWPPANGRLIVVGTDTDVGKTVVSAMLVHGLKASYWKPIQCGELEQGGDSERVAQLTGLKRGDTPPCVLPEAYRLAAPASPNQAAEEEGFNLEEARLEPPAVPGPLVIETAGGLLVPLRDDLLQIEQIKRWKLPVLLVARSGLGTLNHTLLSLEALAARKIPVLGLVLNGQRHQANKTTLECVSHVPVVLELEPEAEITAHTIKQQWNNHLTQGQQYTQNPDGHHNNAAAKNGPRYGLATEPAARKT